MQTTSSGYKWATWILLIVAIILFVLLVRANDGTVTDTFGDIEASIADCRADLEAWEIQYPATATRTPESEGALRGIIEDCMDAVASAQDEL